MDCRASRNRPDVSQPASAAEIVDRPLTIVIPVYNEGANFPSLWAGMTEHLNFPFSALVAYDFDEDDTLPAAATSLSVAAT